eukprot:GEMP01043504.1.p2 GENE.GEMP01043504.1~~GEMP01043504.1.p2  ORF type:complete len:124 (+),score=12.63 GEMP01043504.1:113-484(+)
MLHRAPLALLNSPFGHHDLVGIHFYDDRKARRMVPHTCWSRDDSCVVRDIPKRGRDCTICDITQPNGSLHCEYCNVCVEGYDHHCPWTSKCIGKKNLQDFHIFLATGMSTMLYIILVVAFTRP